MTNSSTKITCGGRQVGVVKGDTFYRLACGSKHMLRTPQAWSFTEETLHQAEEAGATWLQVTDTETGIIYRSTLEHFTSAGFTLDRGYGRQIALPLAGFTRRGKQLSLFGGAV